jgi:hypothetical protein
MTYTYQTIPLSSTGSQSFSILLNQQQCNINVYQLSTGLYCDIAVSGNPIVTTMLCLNLVGLVREAYLGFSGQLFFYDTKGTDDPYFSGLGTRYQLVYQL